MQKLSVVLFLKQKMLVDHHNYVVWSQICKTHNNNNKQITFLLLILLLIHQLILKKFHKHWLELKPLFLQLIQLLLLIKNWNKMNKNNNFILFYFILFYFIFGYWNKIKKINQKKKREKKKILSLLMLTVWIFIELFQGIFWSNTRIQNLLPGTICETLSTWVSTSWWAISSYCLICICWREITTCTHWLGTR